MYTVSVSSLPFRLIYGQRNTTILRAYRRNRGVPSYNYYNAGRKMREIYYNNNNNTPTKNNVKKLTIRCRRHHYDFRVVSITVRYCFYYYYNGNKNVPGRGMLYIKKILFREKRCFFFLVFKKITNARTI